MRFMVEWSGGLVVKGSEGCFAGALPVRRGQFYTKSGRGGVAICARRLYDLRQGRGYLLNPLWFMNSQMRPSQV